MELHVRMSCQPAILLGLVGVEVIQNYVDLLIGMLRDHLIHKIEELSPTASRVMADLDLSGRHLQGCKQGAAPVPFVAVAESV